MLSADAFAVCSLEKILEILIVENGALEIWSEIGALNRVHPFMQYRVRVWSDETGSSE